MRKCTKHLIATFCSILAIGIFMFSNRNIPAVSGSLQQDVVLSNWEEITRNETPELLIEWDDLQHQTDTAVIVMQHYDPDDIDVPDPAVIRQGFK